MERNKTKHGALYLSTSSGLSTTRSGPRKILFFVVSFLAIAIFSSTLTFITGTNDASLIASAAEDEKDVINKGWDEKKYGKDKSGFDKLMEEANSSNSGKDDQSILYAFKRHFTVGYMNDGTKANVAGGAKWYNTPFEGHGKYNCGTDYKANRGSYFPGEKDGTILWHNCDVPNLLTEFLQDISYLILDSGLTGAQTESVATSSKWLGFASNTPDRASQDDGPNITALEAFGYNLKYTAYKGEWDHIKVMTAARALSNFGFMDRLKLGAQALLNGILGGVSSSVNGLIDDFKSGDISRIITSPMRSIKGFFSSGGASYINTIIDTSDTNVFATMSWYRPEFGSTLYNARALSQNEISDHIQGQLAKYLLSIQKKRQKAIPPTDLTDIDPSKLRGLGLPTPGVCTADYRASTPKDDNGTPDNTNDDTVADVQTGTVPNNTNHTDSLADCKKYLNDWVEAKYPDYTITIGNINFIQKKTVGEWNSEAGWEGPVEKYQIFCKLNVDPKSTSPGPVELFLKCLEDPEVGWPAAVTRETKTQQNLFDNNWFAESLEEKAISAFFQKQAASFNAPNAKYICIDGNGKDVKDGEKFVKLIVGKGADQKFNPDSRCRQVRKPIQNGLFGNGYTGAQPPTDTRKEVFLPSFYDFTPADEVISSIGLAISKISTRISNTVLNLAFSPILHSVGADDIIAALIGGFRDSLFFPLAALVIALGALSVFFRAGSQRNYGEQAKSLGMIVVVFFSGTILLANPEQTIKWVDEAPAKVEAVVIGAIFEPGRDESDNLCNSSTSRPAESSTLAEGDQDFFGRIVAFDPSAASRNILCENWRVFALTPYIYGQWGTSYDNLSSANFQAKNEQKTLVGDPVVKLGGASGNNREENWALYQLDLLTAGTVTNYDPQHSKTVSPNMYRLVDLQAGPNNGINTNKTYFDMWSGNAPIARMLVSTVGAGVSLLGMLTIVLFSFAKILISLISMLMLLFLPMMFLIGLFPGQGSYKLKGYIMQIISLMIQRVVLVAMLALLLRIITTISRSTDSFMAYAILTIATCIAFLAHRKEILNLFNSTVVGGSGGFDTNFKPSSLMPRSIKQRSAMILPTAKAGATGAIGGFIVGGTAGAKIAAGGQFSRARQLISIQQNKEGLGTGNIIAQARSKAIKNSDPAVGELESYVDTKFEGAARARATEKLQLGASPGEEITEQQIEKATRDELALLRPRTNKQRREVDRMRRAEHKFDYTSDTRSESDVNKEIQSTINDGEASKNLDALISRGKDTQSEKIYDSKKVDKYEKKVDKVAKSVSENYETRKTVKNLSESAKDVVRKTAPGAAKTLGNQSVSDFVESERQRSEKNASDRAQIKESSKEVMKEFTRDAKNDLSFKEDTGDEKK